MVAQPILIAGLSTLALGTVAMTQIAPKAVPKKVAVIVTKGVPRKAPAVPVRPAPKQPLTTAQVAAPTPIAQPLLPLDLADMSLWNWGGKWHASEWSNWMSAIPWKYANVTQPAGRDTYFRLDASGAPQLQAMNGTLATANGSWEADVTLPELHDGLIVAPLWLWDAGSRDEIDFEIAGRDGLDVTLHANLNGTMQRSSVRLLKGQNLSQQRHRFGIKIDQAAGFVDMYLDGVRVHRWNRAAMGFFVSQPLKPMIEMWAADPNNSGFVSWAGKWAGLAPGQSVNMTVHGFGYTPPR